MKLDKLYKKVIAIGIANDSRGKKAIQKILDEEKEKYKNLKKDDIDYYDKDRLFNPFSDTRILNGNTDMT